MPTRSLRSALSNRPQPLALTETELATQAGPVTFARGREYAHSGRVQLVDTRAAYVAAQVVGTNSYTTELGRDQAGLVWSCSCPLGDKGEFCKHVVAVGLTFLGAADQPIPDEATDGSSDAASARVQRTSVFRPRPIAPSVPTRPAPGNTVPLENFLRGQPTGKLADWLLEAAAVDRELERSLVMRLEAATDRGEGRLKRMVARYLGSASQLNYRQTRDCARRVADLGTALAAAAEEGPAEATEEALEATDTALKRLFKLYRRADDAGGQLNAAMREIGALHAHIAASVVPDARALGANLAELAREDPCMAVRLDEYTLLLGDAGLESYRQTLLRAWAALPAEPVKRYGPHANLVQALDAWYDRVGDLEGWLGVRSRLAEEPQLYREAVDRLVQANKLALADEWAERGLRAYPRHSITRGLAARRRLANGQIVEATALAWDNFIDEPGLGAYALLRQCAGDDWSEWSGRAHAFLRDAEQDDATALNGGRPIRDVRLELLIEDEALDEAWTITERGAAPPYLLLRLGDRLAGSAPARALQLYQRIVPVLVERGDDERLLPAIDLIERVARVTPPEAFRAYLAVLRNQFASRRRFIERIDEAWADLSGVAS